MITEHDIMRRRLLERKGLHEPPEPSEQNWTPKKLEQQWSDEFEQLMRNRICMGAMRYGGMKKVIQPYGFNTVQIRKRLELYEKTGNAEHLVDVANFALVQFVQQTHPNHHFKSIDREN